MTTIVSDKYKILYIHIPKTGGISVNKWFQELDPDAGSISERKHDSLISLKQKHGTKFDSYFKLAVVRNPWSRAVSLYEYRKKMLRGNIRNWPLHWPSRNDVEKMTFKEVVQNSLIERQEGRRVSWLESHCSSWITLDEKIAVDFVCKQENLENDLRKVTEKLGLTMPDLPRLNTTQKAEYTTYYDDFSRNVIAKKCALDIKNFGYEFGH